MQAGRPPAPGLPHGLCSGAAAPPWPVPSSPRAADPPPEPPGVASRGPSWRCTRLSQSREAGCPGMALPLPAEAAPQRPGASRGRLRSGLGVPSGLSQPPGRAAGGAFSPSCESRGPSSPLRTRPSRWALFSFSRQTVRLARGGAPCPGLGHSGAACRPQTPPPSLSAGAGPGSRAPPARSPLKVCLPPGNRDPPARGASRLPSVPAGGLPLAAGRPGLRPLSRRPRWGALPCPLCRRWPPGLGATM